MRVKGDGFLPVISSLLALAANSFCFALFVSNGSFPKALSASEEQKYLELMAQGDMDARNKLIEHNLRLVAHVIKKYYTAVDQEDLISIGTIGLIKGVSTFKPTKGTRLATYAARCIENEILMHFRARKKQANEVSLSDAIERDKEGNTLALMDVISDDCEDLERVDIHDTILKLHRLINKKLDKREREIIALRYGLFNVAPKTQREIAEICKISRSYVSRIETKALSKLKEGFNEK
ncbi:MAG: RNA polymerase sporulation sigma factor SigK [Clostridia bacterium]|nr:RNA polymerase sporulation sigma factor SigK [Clostridia bacterium]